MDGMKDKVSNFSLDKVDRYYLEENYGRAYAHFIVCLELDATRRSDLEVFFVKITSKWCKELEKNNNLENCRYCYNQALSYFPRNSELLTRFGVHYMGNNKPKEAISCFREACISDPKSLQVEKNLESTYSNEVPQWHFRMLNDKLRNKIYKQAIENHLSQIPTNTSYNTVDIGTGSGLLSLFASKFSKENQQNHVTIAAIEESEAMCWIASKIFKQNNAQIQLYHSLSTELHNQHLYNFLFTEIFDCGLFGEGVLSTLIHAHKELLAENAIILPHSAKVYIFGIESNELDGKFRANCGNIPENTGIQFPNCLRKENDGPYEAISINLFDYKRITTVEEVLKVNFNNLEQLEEISYKCLDDVVLEVTEQGICHFFVVYFELFLDEKEQFAITTNPLLRDSDENVCVCWEQAVFYVPHPTQLEIYDELSLQMVLMEDKLHIFNLNGRYFGKVESGYDECDCCMVTSEAITLMNCGQLRQGYARFVDNLREKRVDNTNEFSFLEISAFPLFSVMITHEDSGVFAVGKYHPLYIENRTEAVNFLSLNNAEERCDIVEDLKQDITSVELFDCIVFEPVLESGLLNECFYREIDVWKRRLTPSGVFLPTNVTLCFEMVESQYLETCTQALDTNMFGFDIAKEMNSFAVLEMRSLSGNFERRTLSTVGRKIIINDKDVHEDVVTVKITEDGRLNGFLYWFESWHFCEDYMVSTKHSHNMAAFVLASADVLDFVKDACVDVKIRQDIGLLKISL